MKKKLILHLGGNLQRADKAIELANENPDALILISSQGEDSVKYYTDRGIGPERVFNDMTAWDTVTNFTATYRRIRKIFKPNKIYVVTDGFHMKRSMRIAKAVYFLSGIQLIPSNSSPVNRAENPNYVRDDTIRSWIWKFTRILFYWKHVRESRIKYGIGYPKRWNEIAIPFS
tara:strand:+ start:76 stop:594 length:519 start_codon:yes stop_codon:yes gene_type:complete